MTQTVLDSLAETLHLNHPALSTQFKLGECRHKLEGTFIFFDKELIQVVTLNNNGLEFTKEGDNSSGFIGLGIRLPQGSKFSLFNMDSGVYRFNGVPICFTRRAKKQYKKSFYPEAYNITSPSGDWGENTHLNFYQLPKMQELTFYRYGDSIYYRSFCIADVFKGKLRVAGAFKNEIENAIRYGIITI